MWDRSKRLREQEPSYKGTNRRKNNEGNKGREKDGLPFPASASHYRRLLKPGTVSYTHLEKGNFHPADELENLREEYRLLELLDVEIESYDGFHDNLEVRTRGQLPRDTVSYTHLDVYKRQKFGSRVKLTDFSG